MLQRLKKCAPFFYLFFFYLFLQCSPSSKEHDNSEGNLTKNDSSGFVAKVDSSAINSSPVSAVKKLPTWPSKAKTVKGKRYPFDEATNDLSFVAFREKLYQAINEKDLEFLASIIHDDIKFSFGAEHGKDDFLQTWQLGTNPESSLFWSEMKEVLMLGGGFLSFNKTSFYAPYIFILKDIEDPYSQAVIVGENVRLRDQPHRQGKIIGSLSWDLVEVIYEEGSIEEIINGETHFWQKVKNASGEAGYVYGKYIRSPIDFRAGFSQYDGKWMMDLFIAGD